MTAIKTVSVTKLLTPDELATVQSHTRAVWDYVGYDLLQAVAEDKGKDINAVTIPRAHVIEIVLDADRLDTELAKAFDAAFMTKWKALSYMQRIAAVKPGFTYTRYGM